MLRNNLVDRLLADGVLQWRAAMAANLDLDPRTHPDFQHLAGVDDEHVKVLMNQRLRELPFALQFCAVRLGFAFSGKEAAEALRTDFLNGLAAAGQLLHFYAVLMALPSKPAA